MKKPELLIPAGSLREVRQYVAAGADAIVAGEDRWGLRLPGSMQIGEVAAAISFCRAQGAKLYVAVNRIFHNEELEDLAEYLKMLHELKPDAVIFSDPAVITTMREHRLSFSLHWNAEVTSTNYATAEYWGRRGALRVIAARELNLEEIHEIKRKISLELQVQVHGMTNLYHSERRLLQSYFGHVRADLPPAELERLGLESGYYLVERERPDLRMPVYEDRNGTHIMSPDDICMLDALDELLAVPPDSLKIESLLKPVAYNVAVVRSYRKALDAYYADPENYEFRQEWLDAIRRLQDPHRELTYGFFFKEQVY